MFSTLTRIKNALLYKQGVHFPFSKVRVWALRKLGHHVGKDVYFPADITITQNFVYNRGTLAIGDRVSIAPGVILTLASCANSSAIRRFVGGGVHPLFALETMRGLVPELLS